MPDVGKEATICFWTVFSALCSESFKSVYFLEKENPDSVYAAECQNIGERLQRITELQEEAEREKL